MKKLGFVFAAILAFGMTACGDDDDDVVVDGSTTVDGSTAVDSRVADSGSSTDAAMCMSGVTPLSATAFCTQYGTTCTFGGTDRYTSMSDCVTKYTAFSTTANRQSCATYHLCNAGLPGAGSVTTHCPHATGQSPCN